MVDTREGGTAGTQQSGIDTDQESAPGNAAEAIAYRNSADVARDAIELFCPDADARRTALEIVAAAIREAHAANPQGWEVTLSASRDFIRLNVGRVEIVGI